MLAYVLLCRDVCMFYFFFFSSRRRHTRLQGDWSSDVCSSDLWARVPYAVSLGSIFLIYIGMSRWIAVPSYYFLLHPVSAALCIFTLLRSMVLTLWNDGIEWRGTKYPLEELRKGMV